MKVVDAIEQNGFTIIDRYLDSETIELLIDQITTLALQPGKPGIRNLLELVPRIHLEYASCQLPAGLDWYY
jgi:hypothetical protein